MGSTPTRRASHRYSPPDGSTPTRGASHRYCPPDGSDLWFRVYVRITRGASHTNKTSHTSSSSRPVGLSSSGLSSSSSRPVGVSSSSCPVGLSSCSVELFTETHKGKTLRILNTSHIKHFHKEINKRLK